MKLFITALSVIFSISGCGGTAAHRLDLSGEKDAFVRIIINDQELKEWWPCRFKYEGYCSDFVAKLKDVFKHSFESVSLRPGYNDPKSGELIVIPQQLDLSDTALRHGRIDAWATSSVKVVTDAKNAIMSLRGASNRELSIAESIVLIPMTIVTGIAGFFVGNLEGGAEAPGKLWTGSVTSNALESLAVDAHNKIRHSAEYKEYSESIRMARTSPADLAMTVRFSDSNGFFPNNSLDAGEETEIAVLVRNAGKGMGFGTTLAVTADNPKIDFTKNVAVGDMQPGETKEVKIKLKAELEIDDGKAAFQFTLREKRGYDAKKVIMSVATAKLEKPQLEIVSTAINDGDTGLAKGNGNGIPENGETIELTTFIRNAGVGKAIGVVLGVESRTQGIQYAQDSIRVGAILPGETVKAKTAFAIPRNFNAKEIASDLRVGDSRGVSNAAKNVSLAFMKRTPDIHYGFRIFSKGVEVASLSNDEEYEAEFNLSNKGQISARNVAATLTPSGKATLSRSKFDIGEIKEKTSAPGERIIFKVPRTYGGTQARIGVTICQADFPCEERSLQFPVAVKRPNLKYGASLESKSGGNSLEQGEEAVLNVYVLNDGDLSAEGVKVRIESGDDKLKISGETLVVVGKIPPQARSETIKLPVHALRSLERGENSLEITIAQDDFGPIIAQYALNVVEEGVTTVDVISEERTGAIQGTRSPFGPTINLKTILDVNPTVEDSVRLAFEIADTKNIDAVKITANGALIPLDDETSLTLQPSAKKEISKRIPLKEGENKIVITAYNVNNEQARKEFTITRIAEAEIDIPRVTGLNNPDAAAVVIGISRFENKEIPGVDFARRDASTVKEYLIKTFGFKETNITEFYDEKATATKLKSFFGSKLKSMVKPGVTDVFVFYSGHGAPDTNTNEAYFVPYDYDPYDPATTGFAVKEFYKKIEALSAKSATVVIDACFSGYSGDGKPLIKSASPMFMEVSNPMLKVKNGLVFTSSAGKQISSWHPRKQHGLFTYYFLLGLRGGADKDSDGKITAGELDSYLNRNIPEQARILYNREQTPQVVGDGSSVVVRYK